MPGQALRPDPFQPAIAALARQGRPTLAWTPAFEPLADLPARRVAAVDGSHAVLADTGSVWVVAVRAAALPWPSPRPGDVLPQVHAVAAGEAAALLGQRYAWAGLPPPQPARTAEALADSLRAVEEMEEARHALATLEGPDDILVVDGALHGLPPDAQRLADVLLEAAAVRGVSVVGVSKRSSLSDEGVPVVPALRRMGPPGAWMAAVPGRPGVHVARLHPGAKHCFRVDATDLAAIAALPSLSHDAATLGYPYPLAAVHDAVAFTAGRLAALRSDLEASARRAGVWDLLQDFHAELDRGVAG